MKNRFSFLSALVAVALCASGPAALATQLTGTAVDSSSGSYSYSNNQYTLEGVGSPYDSGTNNNGFGYLAYTQFTGNFDISANVTSEGGPSVGFEGVMAMNSLNSEDTFASTLEGGSSQEVSLNVTSYGAAFTAVKNFVSSITWTRLTRDGNVFTSYYSSDGTTWTELNSSTIDMNSTLYVGLFVTSDCSGGCSLSGYGHIATFSNLSIGPYATSSTGSSTSSAVSAPATLSLMLLALLSFAFVRKKQVVLRRISGWIHRLRSIGGLNFMHLAGIHTIPQEISRC